MSKPDLISGMFAFVILGLIAAACAVTPDIWRDCMRICDGEIDHIKRVGYPVCACTDGSLYTMGDWVTEANSE